MASIFRFIFTISMHIIFSYLVCFELKRHWFCQKCLSIIQLICVYLIYYKHKFIILLFTTQSILFHLWRGITYYLCDSINFSAEDNYFSGLLRLVFSDRDAIFVFRLSPTDSGWISSHCVRTSISITKY